MVTSNMYFYFNGEFLKHNNVININDRGFLLGDGVFTTIKIQNNIPYFIEDHLVRLSEHAKHININIFSFLEHIKSGLYKLLKLNELVNGVIRITVTRGNGSGIDLPNNISSTILITTRTAIINKQPISICKTSIIRNQFSLLTRIKSLNYLELILNRKEASLKGFNDGYMYNSSGAITECSVANIFFITNNNHAVTPKKSDGILDGITRKKVMECCKDLGIVVEERSIYSEELASFNSAFITNSLIGVQQIYKIDQHVLDIQNLYVKKIINNYDLLTG